MQGLLKKDISEDEWYPMCCFLNVSRVLQCLPQVEVSERTFSDLFLVKEKLLETRPLRLKLPRPPEYDTHNNGTENCFHKVEAAVGDSRQQSQGKQPETTILSTRPTTSPDSTPSRTKTAQVIVTAWRKGKKLIFRTKHRPPGGAAGRRGGGGAAIAEVHNDGANSDLVCKNSGSGDCDSVGLLNREGSLIVVHDDEVMWQQPRSVAIVSYMIECAIGRLLLCMFRIGGIERPEVTEVTHSA